MTIKTILVALSIVLMISEIIYICKEKEKKLLFSLIVVFGLSICTVIAVLRNINGMYAMLLTVIVSIMIIIVVSDLRTHYISNVLLIILNVVCLVTALFIPGGNIFASVIVSWLITGILFLISKKSKGEIGTGDIFCMSGLMMSTNFAGVMNLIFISLFAGTVYGLASLVIKKKTLKTEIPFTPFLLIGYLCMMIYV